MNLQEYDQWERGLILDECEAGSDHREILENVKRITRPVYLSILATLNHGNNGDADALCQLSTGAVHASGLADQ